MLGMFKGIPFRQRIPKGWRWVGAPFFDFNKYMADMQGMETVGEAVNTSPSFRHKAYLYTNIYTNLRNNTASALNIWFPVQI